MDLNINVEEHFNQSNNTNNSTNTITDPMDNFDLSIYGLPLDEVYNLARNFIKGIL
jgi:hypothetical protein